MRKPNRAERRLIEKEKRAEDKRYYNLTRKPNALLSSRQLDFVAEYKKNRGIK